jgi:hypothetical protein
MPPVGFEPTIPASARSQTNALERAAAGVGDVGFREVKFWRRDVQQAVVSLAAALFLRILYLCA